MLSTVLWVCFIVIAGFQFVVVSEAARAAANGTKIPADFAFLPLFVGFHEADRFGVHPQWGLLVLLILPAVVGLVAALIISRRARVDE